MLQLSKLAPKAITSFIVLFYFVGVCHSQILLNGDLAGPLGNNPPDNWTWIPWNNPNCQATTTWLNATTDVVNTTGPNATWGMAATPFSGNTCVSGLLMSTIINGNLIVWHEGIEQNVTGFVPGECYVISFYQGVQKQENALDTTGTWEVFIDDNSIGIAPVSSSQLQYADPNINWSQRSFSFVATANTHRIGFLPADDDPSFMDDADGNGVMDADGGLRMALDLVEITPAVIVTPVITPVGPFCSGDAPVTLGVNTTSGVWSGTGITNTNTGTFDPAVAGPGNHIIEYSVSGCIGTLTGQTTITVNESPLASWTNPGIICSDQGLVDLNALLLGVGGGTWSGIGVNGGFFDPSNVGGASFVDITYEVTNGICAGLETQTIQIVEPDNPDWNPPVAFCQSDSYVDLSEYISGVFTGTFSFTPTGLVMNDIGLLDLGASAPGSYDVTYTTLGQCPGSVTTTIQIWQVPIASFLINPFEATNLNTSIEFTNTSQFANNYTWDFGDNSTSNETHTSHQYSSTDEFVVTLYAYSEEGCVDSVSQSLAFQEELIYYVPNTFTPNGDEFNQVFQPVFTSGYDPYDYNLKIFNRWGEMVFESRNVGIGWDGTIEGPNLVHAVQDGTYTWMIEFKRLANDERFLITGHVNVIR